MEGAIQMENPERLATKGTQCWVVYNDKEQYIPVTTTYGCYEQR